MIDSAESDRKGTAAGLSVLHRLLGGLLSVLHGLLSGLLAGLGCLLSSLLCSLHACILRDCCLCEHKDGDESADHCGMDILHCVLHGTLIEVNLRLRDQNGLFRAKGAEEAFWQGRRGDRI